jgi:alkylated DNA repair dioxygenase AlkB
MNSPRIRHLVQPAMSVAERNLSVTNEVRSIMTTTALPTQSAPQGGLELLVSRLAVGMLRWSQQRTAQRTTRHQPTHDEMALLRQIQKDSANATDLARLNRLG